MKENLQNIFASVAILPAGVNNSAEAQTLLMSSVERLAEYILKSSVLKREIRTLGSIKLSGTQELRLRLSLTSEIVESGSPLSVSTI